MTNQKLEILLTLKDQASKKLKNFQNMTGKAVAFMKKNWLALTAAIALTIIAIKKLGDALISVVKSLIEVANKVESLKVRLKVLLGSVEKGNELFKNMSVLAGKVPKTFDEIMTAATDLSAVVRDGVKEVTELMPIIVDISASTGMGVREVTSQVIRMYSAGAAAADMFRERGVSSALGFKMGVSVSAKETMEVLTKQWEDGTGKFVGASAELAKTFDGMTSMMQDAWRQFQEDIGKEMFENVKASLSAVLQLIEESKEEGGKYKKVVEDLSKAFVGLFINAVDFVAAMIVGAVQVIDAWNEVRLFFSAFEQGLLQAKLQMQELSQFAPPGFKSPTLDQDIEDTKAAIMELEEFNAELAQKAIDDESEALQTSIDAFIEAIEVKMEAFRAAEEEKRKEIILTGEGWVRMADDIEARDKFILEARKKAEISYWALATTLKNQFSSGVSKMFMDMIKGSFDAKKAFTALGDAMLQALIDFLVQLAINAVFGKAMLAVELAASSAAAAATAAAWAPAAAMVSLASFGANAVPATIGIASTVAAAQALAVPVLAEGGIVDRPTLALIGERGPEAVIPLNRGGGNRMSQYINIEINNPTIRSDEDIDALTEEISLNLAAESERL